MPSTKEPGKHVRSLDSKGFYSDNYKEGMLYSLLIRSPAPSGKLKSISISNLPEGYFLFTAEDFPGIKHIEINSHETKIFGFGQISYAGEPLGILVGPDEYVLEELAHQVNINFDIEDLEDAFNNVIKVQKKNSEKMNENNSTDEEVSTTDLTNFVSQLNEMPSLNTVIDKTHVEENTETILASRTVKTGAWKRYSAEQAEKKLFAKADFVTSEEWTLQLPVPSWQETAGAFCYMEGKKLHIFAPIKWTYLILKTLAQTLSIPEENIYIHKTKSTGIGSRGLWRTTQICAQVALASFLTKKPVKLVLSQDEQDKFNTLGVQTKFNYKTAVTKNGKIKAMDIHIDIDAGSFNPFAQEITDRLTISACNYYKPENVRIITKCHTSKNPPTSIGIKNLESQAFFAIENQIQKISNTTNLFPDDIRKVNTEVEKTDFPFHLYFDDYQETFENVIKRSDFNRKYASYHMDAIDRVEKDSTPFFGLPLRGIGVSSAYNISSYFGESCFSYDPKIEVTLTKDNKVVIQSMTPSSTIAEIWKNTVMEVMDIKKENVIISSEYTLENIPTSPEDTFSSISTVNEILKKCCQDIQKKRFRQPLPISSAKKLGTGTKNSWNKEKFSGNPFGTSSFASTVVEVELDSYTFSEKIKGIWITINCGEILDKAAALRTIRLEIQQELSRLVEGRSIPCDNYSIDFIESTGKSGQLGDLVHNTLPAAFSTAMSLALDTQLTKVPFSENLIYTLTKEQEAKKQMVKEVNDEGGNK
ncbi:MAG: xanthine dehydrogenase family protein molybdopterin-binding subunit [Treponema sp.]|nr:xanthine dehydrogenase family protein molybdopterin-binding subunit [Treponema sp.]